MLLSPRRRIAMWIRCAVFLLACTAATCQPPPDLDAEPGGARLMNFDTRHPDFLHCSAGDCADWYRVQVPERGDLFVEVESPVGTLEGRSVLVVLANGRALELKRANVSPTEGDAVIAWQTTPGHYMIRVESQDESQTPLPYEIALRLELPRPAAFVPPPPPPEPAPPKFDIVVGEVLEVEGDFSNPDAVLVDRGARNGVRKGQTGRLINGSDPIGSIRIDKTYPEGSRARVEDLSGPILPETRVEIDIPIEDGL